MVSLYLSDLFSLKLKLMIQRIQSLYWLLSAAISVSLFFVPISEKSVFDPEQGDLMLKLMAGGFTSPDGLYKAVWPLLALNVLIAGLSLALIFLYRSRQLQVKMGMLTFLLSCIMLVGVFYYADSIGESNQKSHYLTGTYLIFVQLYILLRAIKAVKKDEELIRSADRIR
jgi:hypothetical protein